MSLPQEIDAIIADAIERRVFPGAVILIAKSDRVLHQRAYGTTMYNAPGSWAVHNDTIYDVASLTKVFTATAALRLSDAGELDIRAPVAAHVPEFRARDVRIWHLLTHTSGLDIRLSALRHAGRDRLLADVYNTTPTRRPGTVVAYTNVNALLLGEVVARLHGTPLDDALYALVTGPLGLCDTQFCPPTGLLPRIAPTEIDEDWRGTLVHGSVHDESAHVLGGVAGHAGLFSTVADLYVFCRMWLSAVSNRRSAVGSQHPREQVATGGLFLKPGTAQVATANHTPSLNAACGLGWMLDRPNFMGAVPPGTFGHTGFTGPAIIIVPQQQLMMVLLSNRIYPRRRAAEHHAVTAAILRAALSHLLP
jgi:CubicO group peptidase (beta-lactamase class C family)